MGRVSKETVKRQTWLFSGNLVRGALAALLLWAILGNLDWYDPRVSLKPAVTVLGPRTEFLLEAGDKDSGLRGIRVIVSQFGHEREVLARTFAATGYFFGSKGSRIMKMEIPFVLDVKELGLKEGRASLEVQVHDFSWRNRFKGRLTTLTREVVINLFPLKVM